MRRRRFLSTAGAVLGSVGLAADAAATQDAPQRGRARIGRGLRVFVVGAGAMGGWTALHLAEMGADVVLIDAYGPANARAASGEETRLTRADYEDPLYARMALEAYDLWSARQRAWKTELLAASGQILLAEPEGVATIERLQQVLTASGVAGVEILGVAELGRRWPHIGVGGIASGLYSPPGRAASVIWARRATQRVAQAFSEAGGQKMHARVQSVSSTRDGVAVALERGETITGDVAVFACGAWMSRLFPDILAPLVRVERYDVLFFGSPPGDARFMLPQTPAWAFINEDYYGLPDLDGRGFKVGPDWDGGGFDPDSDDRRVSPHVVERAQAFLRRRFPALAEQPLLESRACQIGFTETENFIVDRHPANDRVWLMAGDSGHAFKHGPAIGRDTARRIMGRSGDSQYASAFALPARRPDRR